MAKRGKSNPQQDLASVPRVEFEGEQSHWPRPCDLEAKKFLRQFHVEAVLRSDWSPERILIEARAAAACGFIPDACRLFQEAARRSGEMR